MGIESHLDLYDAKLNKWGFWKLLSTSERCEA